MGLGIIAWRAGRHDEARELYEEARTLFAALGYRGELARVTNNIALIHTQRGELRQAFEFLGRARAVFEEIGDWDDLRMVYNNLADVAQRLGDPDAAMGYFEKLLTFAQSRGDQRYASTAAAGLAEVRLGAGHLAAAEESAQLACDEAGGMEPGVERGVAYRVRGEVALARGRAAEAETYFTRALPMLKEAGEQEEAEKAERGWTEARRAQESGT
jgi:tetratricopeptide (TPR) repeat protein